MKQIKTLRTAAKIKTQKYKIEPNHNTSASITFLNMMCQLFLGYVKRSYARTE